MIAHVNMYKHPLIISIICLLVLFVGCTMSPNNHKYDVVSDNKIEDLSISNIEQCKDEYVNKFFLDKFGVDVYFKEIENCDYKHLGYGGAYKYDVSFKDTRALIYNSGMGSGGHGNTMYCFSSSDSNLISIVQNKLCNNLKQLKLVNSSCPDTFEFDATNKMIELCEGGFFTYSTELGKVISYTLHESRCGTSISLGTFECVSENMGINQNKQILKDKII